MGFRPHRPTAPPTRTGPATPRLSPSYSSRVGIVPAAADPCRHESSCYRRRYPLPHGHSPPVPFPPPHDSRRLAVGALASLSPALYHVLPRTSPFSNINFARLAASMTCASPARGVLGPSEYPPSGRLPLRALLGACLFVPFWAPASSCPSGRLPLRSPPAVCPGYGAWVPRVTCPPSLPARRVPRLRGWVPRATCSPVCHMLPAFPGLAVIFRASSDAACRRPGAACRRPSAAAGRPGSALPRPTRLVPVRPMMPTVPHDAWRRGDNAEEMAYVEDPVPPGGPFPPHRPDPPR